MIEGTVDWAALGRQVGSSSATGELGGTAFAERALELILGEDTIRSAVAVILDWQPGSGLARSVLRYIHSSRAIEIAYDEYKSATGDRAGTAVGLIKDIAHPRSLEWVEEFLGDDAVAIWGVGVLDQLIWSRQVDLRDPRVAHMFAAAESHRDENVRRQAAFIRAYIADREASNVGATDIV